MVGFLKKLERTDVPFLQAAEILYGRGARFTLMPLPEQDLCFLPDLVRIQCPADRLFIGSSECAVQALIGTEVGDVQRAKRTILFP